MLLIDGTETCRKKHGTRGSALQEAERLLYIPENKGKGVTLLEAVSYAEIKPLIKWTGLGATTAEAGEYPDGGVR